MPIRVKVRGEDNLDNNKYYRQGEELIFNGDTTNLSDIINVTRVEFRDKRDRRLYNVIFILPDPAVKNYYKKFVSPIVVKYVKNRNSSNSPSSSPSLEYLGRHALSKTEDFTKVRVVWVKGRIFLAISKC